MDRIVALPRDVQALPTDAQTIWHEAFIAALDEYDDEETAQRIAWDAVATQYKRTADGDWVPIEVWTFGFLFSAMTGQYLRASGEVVGRSTVLGLLEDVIAERELFLGQLASAAAEGLVAPADFQMVFSQELKRQYVQLSILGNGGIEQMTPGDWGRIGGYLKRQYGYVSNFGAQIAAGEVTPAQATNRARMYMGNARRVYYRNERDKALPEVGKVLIERRVLGAAEHCPDCVAYADMGWQMKGVLPLPSEQSVCDGNCRCTLLRRSVSIDNADRLIHGGG